jgi:hypothetical protein
MTTSIVDDLIEFFPDEMTVERFLGADADGNKTYGAPFVVKCRIVGRTKDILDEDGDEVVSNVQSTTAGAYNLSSRDRYTLPVRFSADPSDENNLEARQPKALAIDRSTDESGPHHEIVQFSGARIRTF